MEKNKIIWINAFLLGVAVGFLLTPIRKGVNVNVENYMEPKHGKKSAYSKDQSLD